jgi:dTDP-glucose 4,6-dehydratase
MIAVGPRGGVFGAMGGVVVTGGAGFIGCNFVRHLLRRSEERVVVVDKLTYAGNRESLADVEGDPRFAFVRADIADGAAMRALFAEVGPQAVVNFAAETHVDRSIDDPSAFVRTNVVGVYELLEAARRFLAAAAAATRRAFRFLHVSTDEVYGTLGASGRFSETTPYAPNSPYAASKAGADHLVRAYHETYGLPVLVTNCSNNFGPFQFPEKLVPLMILNAIEGRDLPIYGDGGNIRDWLFVEDHCAAVFEVLRRGRVGEKYNVGGDNERTNVEVVERICAAVEEERPARQNARLAARGVSRYLDLRTFVGDRPGHDRRYAIDATKVRSELGWRPAHGFDAALRLTVRWYLEHEEWCHAVQSGKYRRERLGLPEPAAGGGAAVEGSR